MALTISLHEILRMCVLIQLQFAAQPVHSQQHELPPSNVWLRSLCSTPAMAPNEHLKELPTIDTKCLEILKTFGYKGGNYSIKVSFGTFSISLENGNRIPEPVPVRRRKRPYAIKLDKNRRIEFLKNKNSATSSRPFSTGVNTLEEARVLDLQPSIGIRYYIMKWT